MREILTLAEIKQRYPNEWVCLKVTGVGRNGYPLAGMVIAHHRDKAEVMKAARAFRSQHPRAHGALFFTGELIPQGLVVVLAAME